MARPTAAELYSSIKNKTYAPPTPIVNVTKRPTAQELYAQIKPAAVFKPDTTLMPTNLNGGILGATAARKQIDAQMATPQAQSFNQMNKYISSNPWQQAKNNFNDLKTNLFGSQQEKDKLNANLLQARQTYASPAQSIARISQNPTGAVVLGAANDFGIGQIAKALTGDSTYQNAIKAAQQAHPNYFAGGSLAGYIAPGSLLDKGVSIAAKPLLAKLGTSVVAKIGGKALTAGVSNASLAGLSDVLQQKPLNETLKDVGSNALVGGAFGGTLGALGNIKGIKTAVSELGAKGLVTPSEKIPSNILRAEKVASDIKFEKLKQDNIAQVNKLNDLGMQQAAAEGHSTQLFPKVGNMAAKVENPSTVAQSMSNGIPEGGVAGFGKNTVGAGESQFPYKEKVSEFYNNTVQNSAMFNQTEKDMVISQAPEHQIISEKQSLLEAKQSLQTDFEAEVKDLMKAPEFNGVATDKAMGILEAYRNEGRVTGDYSKMINWANETANKAHDTGQALQALSKYTRTPEGLIVKATKVINDEATGMLKGKFGDSVLGKQIAKEASSIDDILKRPNAEKNIEDILKGDKDTTKKIVDLFNSGKYSKDELLNALKEKYKVPTLNNDDVAQISEIMDKWAVESDPKLKDAYIDQVANVLANKMPANFWDKADAWRYMSMLLNFKTHARNIIGNAAMDVMRREKNLIGAGLEKALPVEQRTKAIITSVDKGITDFAKVDYTNVEGILRQSSKLDFQNLIQSHRKIFDTTALEYLRKMGMKTLDAEDLFFMQGTYTDTLAQTIKARKLDPAFLMTKEGEATLNNARKWAMREALRSTYHENSKLAGTLNRIENTNRATKIAMGGLLPFKKTPINILKQGARYSPAGLIKGLTWDISQLRKGNLEHGAAELIDNISMGLSGTSIAALGAWFMSSGLITLSSNATGKEGTFEGQTGYQNYALKIGNSTFTIDWITPSSMPFFMGAEMYKTFTQQNNQSGLQKVGTMFTKFADSLTQVSDPLMNLSMLQGINNTIKSAAYGGNPVSTMIGTAASGYVGQYVPTLLGQAARTITPNQKDTYSTDALGKTVNAIKAKIPFANLTLPDKVDQWGNPISQGNIAQRAGINFVSPSYVATANTTVANTEVQRLYDATGDTAAMPSQSPSYIAVNGKRYDFTPQEKQRYATTMGQAAKKGVTRLLNNSEYTRAKDYVFGTTPDKLGMITKAYATAKQVATAEFLKNRGVK